MERKFRARIEAVLNPDDFLLVRESRLNGNIDKLPATQRTVIDLRFPEDEKVLPRTQNEIATETKTSRKAAIDKEKRAINNLKKLEKGKEVSIFPMRGDITEDMVTEAYERLGGQEKVAFELKCTRSTVKKRLTSARVKINRVGRPRKN